MHQISHIHYTSASETKKLEILVAAMTTLKAKLYTNVILITLCGLMSVLNNQIYISMEKA